jgi:membrane protein
MVRASGDGCKQTSSGCCLRRKRSGTLTGLDLGAIRRRLEATFIGRCVGSFIALQGIDRAMVIASQALTALIPLLILSSTLAPPDRRDQQAWRLEAIPGVRGSLNTALGLAALLLEIALLYLARPLVRALPINWVLGVPISILTGLLLWTSIPWLLLDRRVDWRRLVPAGLLGTACSGVYTLASTVYMPRLIDTYSERYGLFGVTLALLGWLLCVA